MCIYVYGGIPETIAYEDPKLCLCGLVPPDSVPDPRSAECQAVSGSSASPTAVHWNDRALRCKFQMYLYICYIIPVCICLLAHVYIHMEYIYIYIACSNKEIQFNKRDILKCNTMSYQI